jgi:hypothetical protein
MLNRCVVACLPGNPAPKLDHAHPLTVSLKPAAPPLYPWSKLDLYVVDLKECEAGRNRSPRCHGTAVGDSAGRVGVERGGLSGQIWRDIATVRRHGKLTFIAVLLFHYQEKGIYKNCSASTTVALGELAERQKRLTLPSFMFVVTVLIHYMI